MPRIEIKTLFALTVIALCCIPTALLLAQGDLADQAVAIEEAWDAEQEVLEKITELGGWYKIEECLTDDMKDMVDREKQKFVVEVNMVYNDDGVRQDNDNVTSDALQHIARFTQVKRILLKETQANDDQLALLADLEHVEAFFIWDAHDVSDEGIQHLAGFSKLKKLHLSDSLITDEGIGCLTGLRDIQQLSLQSNNFTDKIFEYASEFAKLETLWVGTGVTDFSDEGLKHLYKCDKLKTLGIQRCDISTEAVDKLREKLPELSKLYHSNR